MGFLIQLTHEEVDQPPLYFCAVPADDAPDDFVNTPCSALEEARDYPYPTAEVAAHVIASFPQTKNVIYSVIEVDTEEPSVANSFS